MMVPTIVAKHDAQQGDLQRVEQTNKKCLGKGLGRIVLNNRRLPDGKAGSVGQENQNRGLVPAVALRSITLSSSKCQEPKNNDCGDNLSQDLQEPHISPQRGVFSCKHTYGAINGGVTVCRMLVKVQPKLMRLYPQSAPALMGMQSRGMTDNVHSSIGEPLVVVHAYLALQETI